MSQVPAPRDVVRAYLADNDIEFDESGRGALQLLAARREEAADRGPARRRRTRPRRARVRLPKPDENHERVYEWLLQRNLRLYAVSFAVDRLGDIYLDARLPLAVVDPDELDRLLGAVLSAADESFNTILELGFASSIRKEWEWRRERGEPTHNLEAFRGLARGRGRQLPARTKTEGGERPVAPGPPGSDRSPSRRRRHRPR